MPRARSLLLVALSAGYAGCAVRAPAPLDITALVNTHGPVEARQELELRTISEPRDVAARLALAALAEIQHRPTEALEALEAVLALGGPLGPRWHPDDQARMARLIAARGRARLTRGAASAVADLVRARTLGAAISDGELRRAEVARAISWLRHSDGEVREQGRQALAQLAQLARAPDVANGGANGGANKDASDVANEDATAWRGALPAASPAERGAWGAWLWDHAARRAAWDALSTWHDATHAPRDPALQDAYLVAARWWTPMDRPGPPPEDLLGSLRCAFAPPPGSPGPSCAPHDIAGENLLERAYLIAPIGAPVRDPDDAAALAAITLHQALRGEVSWGAALAARVDLPAFAEPHQLARLPRYAQPIFARLTGAPLPTVQPADATTPDQRLVLAAERVLAGGDAAEIEPLIGNAPYADELRRVATTRAAFPGPARAEAATRHAGLSVPGAAAADPLRAVAAAYTRDPAIADRLGRDLVAGAADAAVVHAVLGALFDALGDPARARAAWQAAVDASSEPGFIAGLAAAEARQGDADAALINATTAAAASGDPAIVWTRIAHALLTAGKYVHALDASRTAIDLSGPDTLEAALETAIAASAALGRPDQVASLSAQRARIAQSQATFQATFDDSKASSPDSETRDDPTDARAALAAYRRQPTSATIARLWVAARWNPRAVELRSVLLAATTVDDPRHAVIVAELVELAGDHDPELRRAAVAALR